MKEEKKEQEGSDEVLAVYIMACLLVFWWIIKQRFHRHEWEYKKTHYMPPNKKRKFPVAMWVYRCRVCNKFGVRPVRLMVKMEVPPIILKKKK